MIDSQHFTPISAIIGGIFIGTSVILLYWCNGRIAGISGIFHRLFTPQQHEFLWRLLFLIGLMIGSQIYYFFPQIHFTPRTHYPIPLLILAGFFVGIGTKLGNGCTSGHGVCGMARLSKRSIIATFVFIFFGILTVYLLKPFGIQS